MISVDGVEELFSGHCKDYMYGMDGENSMYLAEEAMRSEGADKEGRECNGSCGDRLDCSQGTERRAPRPRRTV